MIHDNYTRVRRTIALFNKHIEIRTNINCYCLSDVKVVDEWMMIDFIFYMIFFFLSSVVEKRKLSNTTTAGVSTYQRSKNRNSYISQHHR